MMDSEIIQQLLQNGQGRQTYIIGAGSSMIATHSSTLFCIVMYIKYVLENTINIITQQMVV